MIGIIVLNIAIIALMVSFARSYNSRTREYIDACKRNQMLIHQIEDLEKRIAALDGEK